MSSTFHTDPNLVSRVVTWLRDDVHVARLALGAVALHVADDNLGARRVYEALGFTVRARIDALILRAPS